VRAVEVGRALERVAGSEANVHFQHCAAQGAKI
jgi:hypothetical protein